MATLRYKISRLGSWQTSDKLQLVVGTEDAANLAGSTPAGGTVVREVEPWPNAGQTQGGWGAGLWSEFLWGVGPLTWPWGADASEWGGGVWGGSLIPRLIVDVVYRPTLVCCTLPVGVKLRDLAGNISTVLESLVTIKDPPIGARNLRVASSGDALEARLTFTQSPHVS